MDILEYIKQMQEMYGEDVITTADKLEKPPKTVVREMFQNAFTDNKAYGGRAGYNDGQLVTPNVDGSRPGYRGPEKFPIPKGYITANQLAEELGISKLTLKKYRLKNLPVDKYPLKGFIDETFKPFKGKSSATGTATYYLKPTEKMLENYQNFKNRTVISRDLLNDVEKLHKSKLFKDLVKSKNKSLPTLEEVVKVLGKETKAHHRAANAVSVLAKMYQGNEYKLLKLPKNEETGKFIFKALKQGGKNNPYKQAYYQLAIEEIDKSLGNETGTLKNFKRYFKDNLTKYLGKGHGVSLNEVASISGMVSNDMAPYGAFVDLTNTKINNDLLAGFQGDLSKALTKIDGLKGKEKLLAIKQFNEKTLPKFKKRISDQYGKKLANSIRFTEIVPGTKLTDTYKAKDLAKYKTQGIDLQSLAKKKGYYLDVKGAKTYTEFLENKKLTKAGKINAMEKLEQDLLKIARQIDPDGCGRKAGATGGRIGLKFGSTACATKAKNYLNQVIDRGIQNEPSTRVSLIKKILSGTGNFIKQNLSPKELLKVENLIGKPALYATAVVESGLLADDVLRKKEPINVAAAENFLFGNLFNLDADAERAKNLLESGVQLSPAAQEYAQNILDQDKYRKNEMSFPASLISLKMPGSDKYLKMQEDLKNKIINTPDTGKMDYKSALDEFEGTFKAKPKENKFFFDDAPDKPEITPLTNKIAKPPRRRIGPMTAKKEMKVDFSLPTYLNSFPASNKFLNQYLESIGKTPLQPGEGTLFRMNQPDQRGLYGTQEKFASGGLASLTDTIPPESGPMSEGLRSLYNNGKKL